MSIHAPSALDRPTAFVFRDMSLRAARAADAPFERALFETARPDATLLALWPEAQRKLFLDHQFLFQTVHYSRAYPDAARLIVLKRNNAIGRLILDRAADEWHVVDIALLPRWRSQGIGARLLQWVQAAATVARAPCVRLSVDFGNPARRLYERLGFNVDEDGFPSLGMVWRPGPLN